MATRLALTAALLLSTLTAHAAQAQEQPDADTLAMAAQAGVPALDVQGALNALADAGMPTTARTYLTAEGDLPAPVAQPLETSVIPSVWQRIAQCESNGNWQANTGNGYFGGLQEDMRFWTTYGGRAYASRPDLAPPAAQVAVAIRGQSVQGYGAWPACSRRLGLH